MTLTSLERSDLVRTQASTHQLSLGQPRSMDAIQQELRALELPEHPSILAVLSQLHGFEFEPGVTLGIPAPLALGDPTQPRSTYWSLEPGDFRMAPFDARLMQRCARRESERTQETIRRKSAPQLVPFYFRSFAAPGQPRVGCAIDEQGRVHAFRLMGDTDWDPPGRYSAFAFDHVPQFMEVCAALGGFWLWPLPNGLPLYASLLYLDQQYGAAWAQTLELDPHEPACGTHCRTWIGERGQVVELNISGFVEGTWFASNDTDQSVAFLFSLLQKPFEGGMGWVSHSQIRGFPKAPERSRMREDGRWTYEWGSPKGLTDWPLAWVW